MHIYNITKIYKLFGFYKTIIFEHVYIRTLKFINLLVFVIKNIKKELYKLHMSNIQICYIKIK
jgi:hypothetical protein